jgi:hypothetical protein
MNRDQLRNRVIGDAIHNAQEFRPESDLEQLFQLPKGAISRWYLTRGKTTIPPEAIRVGQMEPVYHRYCVALYQDEIRKV